MRDVKHKERAKKGMMEFLAKAGVPLETIQAVADKPIQTAQDKSMEAEAALLYIENPRGFMVKVCKRETCSERFSTNYKAVAYCSDHCRKMALKAIGIEWDPIIDTPTKRWGGNPPLIVTPEALRVIQQQLPQSQTQTVHHHQSETQPVAEPESDQPSVTSPALTTHQYEPPELDDF